MNKMNKHELRTTEKLFKRCFKKKISITLGAVIMFLMTGCSGGSGSSTNSSSQNTQNGGQIIKPTTPDIIEKPSTSEKPIVPELPVVPENPNNPGEEKPPVVEKPTEVKAGDVVETVGETTIIKTENGYEITSGSNKGITISEDGKTFTEKNQHVEIQYKITDNPNVFNLVANMDKATLEAQGIVVTSIEAQVNKNKELVGNKEITVKTNLGNINLKQDSNNLNKYYIQNTEISELKNVEAVIIENGNYTYIEKGSQIVYKKQLDGKFLATKNLVDGGNISWFIDRNGQTDNTFNFTNKNIKIVFEKNRENIIKITSGIGSNAIEKLEGAIINFDNKENPTITIENTEYIKEGNYYKAKTTNNGNTIQYYLKKDGTFSNDLITVNLNDNPGSIQLLKKTDTVYQVIGGMGKVVEVDISSDNYIYTLEDGSKYIKTESDSNIYKGVKDLVNELKVEWKKSKDGVIQNDIKIVENVNSIILTKAENNNKFTMSGGTGHLGKLDGATIDFSGNKPVISKDGNKYIVNKNKQGEISYTTSTTLATANGNIVTWGYDKNGKFDGVITVIDRNGKQINLEKIGDEIYKVIKSTYPSHIDIDKIEYNKIESSFTVTTADGLVVKLKQNADTETGDRDYTIIGGEKPSGVIDTGIRKILVSQSGEVKYVTENDKIYKAIDENTYEGSTIVNGEKAVWRVNKNGQLSGNILVGSHEIEKIGENEFKILNGKYEGVIIKPNNIYEKDGLIYQKENSNTYKVTGIINIDGYGSKSISYKVDKDGNFIGNSIMIDDQVIGLDEGYIIHGNLKLKEIKEFSKNGNSYIIKHNENKYIYSGGNKETYIDLTKLEKAINNTNINTKDILTSITYNGKTLENISQIGSTITSSIGQLYNGEKKNENDIHSLVNIEKIDIKNGRNLNDSISLSQDILAQAIGQAVNFGGAEAYNFGSIKVASETDIAVGQYVTGNNNLAIGRLAAYNFGLIDVFSSGQKSIIPNEKINSAGIYINSIKTPVIGANFGTIKINNTNNNEYYGVGMLADGKGAKVFNFGTIEVTEAAVSNNNDSVTPENQKFMVAKNGGRVYNYGTLKSNGKDIVVDGKVSSSTTAKYITDNKVIFTDEVEILSEVGKGDSYTIDSYITAKNGVEGLDQIKSTGVYETKAIEKIDENGNTVVDLKLEKTKKIEDLTTGDLNRMIKEANLDSYVYADGKGKNAEAINYLVSTGKTENLKGIFAPVYENLNGSILKSAERFNDYAMTVNSNEITEISGDFNRNFRGFFANDTLPNVKFGIFKNYRKDANLGAGIDYNRDSTTVIGSQYLTSNFVLNYGYENNKNEYETGAKLETHNIMLGVNYIKDITNNLAYNLSVNTVVGKNKMKNNGKINQDFYSYSAGMTNKLETKLNLEYFTSSEFNIGLRTIVFGHEDIKDKNIDAKINDSLNVSNTFVTGLDLTKDFEITKNTKFNLNTKLVYEKELMNTEDWKDSVTILTGSTVDYGRPVKDDKVGKIKGVVSGEIEFSNGISTGAYISMDSLGYKEGGITISYKF